MEGVFNAFKYLGLGLLALFGLLVVATLLFGKRVIKKWEFDADFHDDKGREFGELDIELSRIDKQEPDFTFKAKFKMRHPALTSNSAVQVYLDDVLLLEGQVKTEGRVFLGKEHLKNQLSAARSGQVCRVVCGGQELARQEIVPD